MMMMMMMMMMIDDDDSKLHEFPAAEVDLIQFGTVRGAHRKH